MKKLLPALLLQCLFTTVCVAQNIIAKVPDSATVVIKFSGASLSQKLPAAKFDTYSSLKKKLFEELKLDPKTSLEDMGIDMQQDAYQYVTANDTTVSFVTLAYLKDDAKFNQFILKRNKSKIPFETKAGFQLYPVGGSVYLGWNGNLAALVVLDYTDNSYYHEPYVIDSTKMFADVGKTTPFADSSIAVEEVKPTEMAPVVDTTVAMAAMDSATVALDSATIMANAKRDSAQALIDSANDRKYREASAKFYKEKDIKDSLIQKGLAENALRVIFDSTVISIQNKTAYKKLVDSSADISVWIGSMNMFEMYRYHHMYYNFPYLYNMNSWLGYKQGINVFFENNKVRIEQRLTSTTDSSLQLFKNVFKSQQNPALVNYLQPSDLGYISVSVNTEAMVNYYYPLLKATLAGEPYLNKYSESIDAYVDLLQVVIDEKGIADMLPGNALLVLHSLKQKQVEYVSYDYDKNFNSMPTKKMKTEMSPDFTFVFETKNENIFNKFAHLPVKLGKENNFNYTKTGDYYTLALGKDSYFDSLYFMVKNGKCIITTSLQDLKEPVAKTTIDPVIKQSILNSNYSGLFNIKGLLKSMSGEVTDKKNKKMVDYLQNNVNDITFESSLKGDIIQTTAVLNIDGTHKNSVQYFFDVIEKLLEISEQ